MAIPKMRHCMECGARLTEKYHEQEKKMIPWCPVCGDWRFPVFSTAVSMLVMNADKSKILLIKQYGRDSFILVAGYVNHGEDAEHAVVREVMEETGVRVKNIRYYKSQPWGMAQDMLVGFYCEADGSGEIHMDENELKYAEWVKREDVVLQPSDISLTNEMMKQFRDGNI